MSISYRLTYEPVIDRNGWAVAQQLAGAGALALAGAFVAAPPGQAQKVSIYSAGDISGANFTIVGTDRWGFAKTEVVAGPDTSPDTNYSTGNFLTVTSITSDAAVATDVEVGSMGTLTGPWVKVIPDNPTALYISTSGTITAIMQGTYGATASTVEDSLVAETAVAGSLYTAVRYAVTAQTNGTITVYIGQQAFLS